MSKKAEFFCLVKKGAVQFTFIKVFTSDWHFTSVRPQRGKKVFQYLSVRLRPAPPKNRPASDYLLNEQFSAR